jgi:ElaB/YqjD/DUF883 family membrane-anchored ribosome-binding protein
MRNLISAQEVIDLAFAESSNMREDSISATSISVAEIKYIRPAFGAMFPLLGEKYADFTNEYVKPALAYFVKCEIIASIAIDMSNSGVAVANPQYQSAATDKQRQRLYDSEMSKAKTLLDFALEYIATHSEEFPDFSGTAPKKHYRLGGLILGNGGGSRSQSASIAGDAFKAEFDRYIKDMQAISEEVGDLIDSTTELADKADEATKAAAEAVEATNDAIQKAETATKNVNEAIERADEATTNANNAAKTASEAVVKLEGIGEIQEKLTLSIKDNGNIVIGNLDGQTKEFMPATPSGVAEHYTWLKYNGVTYGTFIGADGNTYGQEGKWGVYAERGGLADLTNEDMRQVVADKCRLDINSNSAQAVISARTNLIVNNNGFVMIGYSFSSFLRASANLEVANLSLESGEFKPADIGQMFLQCSKLKKVIGTINCQYLTTDAKVNIAFGFCPALEEVQIFGLKTNISFANSPNLSYGSVLYMVENSDLSATPQIIITLHPTAYDRIVEYDQSEDNPTAGDLMEYLGAYNHIDIARG